MSFLFLIVVGLGLVLLLGLVVLVVLLAMRGKGRSEPARPVRSPAMPAEDQQAARTRILQELSEGKITREAAEEQMAGLRGPGPPSAPPTHPPATGQPSGGRGCLWAILAAVVAGLALLILVLMFFGIRVSHVAY